MQIDLVGAVAGGGQSQSGGEERAIAVAQAVQADFAEMAVRVVYLERPPKRLPYVMIMMGGSYKDTSSGPAAR